MTKQLSFLILVFSLTGGSVFADQFTGTVRFEKRVRNWGWSCRTAHDNDPMFLANIWYELSSQEGSYKMRIQEVKGRTTYQVAYLDHAFYTSAGNQVHIAGTDSGAQIDLTIDEGGSEHLDLPGILSITMSPQRAEGFDTLSETVEMICNRTRFSVN